MSAAAFGFGEASDDALDLVADFDLQPLPAAALFVAAVAALRDDAFELAGFRDVEEGASLLGVVIGIANRVFLRENRLQLALAVFEIDLAPVFSVEIDEIESVIKDGDVGVDGTALASGTKSGALLHQAERRLALGVECDDFAVENGSLRLDGFRHVFQFGITGGEFVLVARDQADFAVLDEGYGAVAVPFDFEEPVGAVEGIFDGLGEHGGDACR